MGGQLASVSHPQCYCLFCLKPRARAPNSWYTDDDGNLKDQVQCQQVASVLADEYLNHPTVKVALHVDRVPAAANWTVCANVRYTRSTPTQRDLYTNMITKYRALIFSGDADGCVPWNGSEEWTRKLNFPVKAAWHPWTAANGVTTYTAGFVTDYATPKGFSFLTIKHAGHMVPQYEPESAITFFQNFLSGAPY